MADQLPLHSLSLTAQPVTCFADLDAALRVLIWNWAICLASPGDIARLPFEEGNFVFVDKPTPPGNGNALRRTARLFLKPKAGLAGMTRGIRNLTRVCHEARYEVFRRYELMPVLVHGLVPFRPNRDTICICTSATGDLFPVQTTNKKRKPTFYRPHYQGSLRDLRPMSRYVRSLAWGCLLLHDESFHERDCLAVLFLILASEARRLYLVNVDQYCTEFVNDIVALRTLAYEDVSTRAKWICRSPFSKEFLEQRWYRLKETALYFGGTEL